MADKPKRVHLRIPGYLRLGRRYLSKVFLLTLAVGFSVFCVLYLTVLHPMVVQFWQRHQELPEFSIDSPYLADYTGRARLLLPNSTLIYQGQLDGGAANGEGELYDNGVLVYKGEFADNFYDGAGTLYAPDGTVVYKGLFAANLYQGAGTLFYQQDGIECRYEGDFDGGIPLGAGRLFSGGTLVYHGPLADGLYEGQGRLYQDGVLRYDGVFRAGEFDGRGKLYDDGGLCYEGDFQNGTPHGEGQSYENGSLRYRGGFEDGRYQGEGTLYDAFGFVLYQGGFHQGQYEGKGLLYLGGTPLYEGDFRGGLYDGEGWLYQNGILCYAGGFRGGLYDGEGTEFHTQTGHPVFAGRYSMGGRTQAGTLYDDHGVPITVPLRTIDPLTLLGCSLDDVLSSLTGDGIPYREQALPLSHLVVDDASGTLYVFADDDDEGAAVILRGIYLCGLTAAGGYVVGAPTKTRCATPLDGDDPADLFALMLSDAYWGRDTKASSLGSLVTDDGDHRYTVVAEQPMVPSADTADSQGVTPPEDDALPAVSEESYGEDRIVYIKVTLSGWGEDSEGIK